MTKGRRDDVVNGRRLFRRFFPEFVKSAVKRCIDIAPLGIFERQDESLSPFHIPRQCLQRIDPDDRYFPDIGCHLRRCKADAESGE